ncbi:transcriptional activator of glycolytic enzymes-domain-containing protein [Phycomyces blakesleeanus]|uniref:Transcriptional activator of glycolytic enzymes-domain-containing protein n=1 Tax=Phycomyces blakesleeanus TaxID=4837 RepID=A0ABR3BEN6_PHYBL
MVLTSTDDINNPGQGSSDHSAQNVLSLIFKQLENLNTKLDNHQATLQRLLLDQQHRQSQDKCLAHSVHELRADMQLLREASVMFGTGTKYLPSTLAQSSISPLVSVSVSVSESESESPSVADLPLDLPVPTSPVWIQQPTKKSIYSLSRDIVTVTDLWREWSVGLSDAMPSVIELNKTKGSSWRSIAKERQFYSRRLIIVNKIYKVKQTTNCSIEEAVGAVELLRTEMKCNINSNKINNKCK